MNTSFFVETDPRGPDWSVRVLLRVTGEPPHDERRMKLNLGLVLDRSGSMAGGKLAAVKRAAADLVRRLHPDDRVSVVSFDSHVEVVAPPSTAAERPNLTARLLSLQPGGCTNLSGGWLQGRALVERHLDAAGVNRVFLLTDGLANEGITDSDLLRRLCGEALQQSVSTTTVGVGADYDEDLLAAMAEAGGGSAYYIERVDQTADIFEEELEGLLSISAQNLTVSLTPRDAADVAMVHHSYPARAEGDRLILTLGDLYAREPAEVLADFVVRGTDADAEDERAVVDVVVEADVLTADGGLERRRITLPVTFRPREGAVSDPEVSRVYTLLRSAQARRRAMELGDEGDVGGAVHTLREAAALLEASDLDPDLVAAEVQEHRALASEMEAQRAMSAADRKFLFTKARMYSRGRRSAGDRIRRGH